MPFRRRDRALDPTRGDANHRPAPRIDGWGRRTRRLVSRAYDVVTLPWAAWHIFDREYIHEDHDISAWDLSRLAVRMWWNVQQVWTGAHVRAHFMMAQALFEFAPTRDGVVVECGCFLGGTTANLSLACEMVGRELIVYDSFEGLPPPENSDAFARDHLTGFLRSDLDRVKNHISRYGCIEVCDFRKGWFRDTLPEHTEPIVMAFLDVDYQASLHDCMVNLWPRMVRGAALFTDEYVLPDYCALFWSESWWDRYMPGERPPGLMGAGSGVPLGGHYVGPLIKYTTRQMPHSLAYTRRGSRALWEYEPPT